MTLKRMTPALLAASVFLSGAAGLFIGSMTPANAITSVDELSDVNRNHWAFEALRDLVEKYDVIEGYPDGTFRGNRFPTRWEMAAALNALVKTVGRDLARLGAEKADKKDLQTLARLQEEFRNELNALNGRVKSLEDRASAIEAKNDEQDSRLTLLEKTQIHGDFSVGVLSDISRQNVRAVGSRQSGVLDGLSAVGRLRLALDVPVKDENEESKIGRGDLYTRLVAAFGRNATQDGIPSYSGYSRISADADKLNNDGLFTSSDQSDFTGVNSRSNLYLESAYYKQNFKSGIPVLTSWMGLLPEGEGWETTGDLYVGVVPWRFLFDKSPYRGNELTQFQNTSLVNTPGIAVNVNQPMIAYQMHQGLGKSANLDLTAAFGSIDVGDVMDGMNVSYEARLNYITSFLGDDWAKPGSIYGGGYHIWRQGNSLASLDLSPVNRTAALGGSPVTRTVFERDTSNAFYVGMNQEWWGGIGTFVNYTLANSADGNFLFNSQNQLLGANTAFLRDSIGVGVRQALSVGLSVPMSAVAPGWRDEDVLGVGYAMVDFHEQGLSATGRSNRAPAATVRDGRGLDTSMEKVLEVYYKMQATDNISVVPSAQFLFNRLGLGGNGFTTVVGVRTNFLF
ncbi:MAG: carbohydrate porin [Vampirovibrionales bacterium]|nr:carbohydrate porin [Vampirovibrionales bacterium]